MTRSVPVSEPGPCAARERSGEEQRSDAVGGQKRTVQPPAQGLLSTDLSGRGPRQGAGFEHHHQCGLQTGRRLHRSSTVLGQRSTRVADLDKEEQTLCALARVADRRAAAGPDALHLVGCVPPTGDAAADDDVLGPAGNEQFAIKEQSDISVSNQPSVIGWSVRPR